MTDGRGGPDASPFPQVNTPWTLLLLSDIIRHNEIPFIVFNAALLYTIWVTSGIVHPLTFAAYLGNIALNLVLELISICSD